MCAFDAGGKEQPVNDDWTPISRTGQEAEAVSAEAGGTVQVVVHLSELPPREWAVAFLNPSGLATSTAFPPPRLEGKKVLITPPEEHIASNVKEVDARIAHANAQYSNEVIPARDAERRRREAVLAEQEARRRRIEDQLRDL
jgi:hypothetical protein